MLRATTEGATFALRFGIDELGTLGLKADSIVLTGGGANSRIWRQIVADVTGLPVTLLQNNEGACYGAALQALWSLERRTDARISIGDITDLHVEIDSGASARPDGDRKRHYDRIYVDYQRAVEAMTPLFPH